MYASMPFSDLSNDFAKVMSKHYPCKRDTDMIQVSNLDPKSSEINKLKSDLEQTQTTIVWKVKTDIIQCIHLCFSMLGGMLNFI